MKLLSFLSIAVLFASNSLNAQQREVQMNINYSYAMPVGSFSDIVGNNSGRGFQASMLYGISDKFAVGLGTGFQDFYQKNPRQLYKTSDGSDISAVVTYSVQTIPLLLQGKYYMSPEAAIQPYAALGLGGNMIMFRELLGEFGDTETKFGFAARPEAGVFVPFRKNGEAGFNLGVSYNLMPFKNNAVTNLNSVAVSAGFKFMLRR